MVSVEIHVSIHVVVKFSTVGELREIPMVPPYEPDPDMYAQLLRELR